MASGLCIAKSFVVGPHRLKKDCYWLYDCSIWPKIDFKWAPEVPLEMRTSCSPIVGSHVLSAQRTKSSVLCGCAKGALKG